MSVLLQKNKNKTEIQPERRRRLGHCNILEKVKFKKQN